ncbi:MAG: prepilin-type N-terminal cleavage/methylation domain-containing protein [Planctomycetes bacterium]|nr:prepilin-type N-terminal cleavage/methylation domain-containing protein [Planctomycetota bacterium]
MQPPYRTLRRGLARQRGWTMMELIITIIILGIISGVSAIMVLEGGHVFIHQNSRADNLENARLTIERVTRDILHIKDGSVANITNFGPTSIAFTAFDNEAVSFEWDAGAKLLRRRDKILATQVIDFRLLYLTETDTPATTADAIWTITADVTIEDYGQKARLRTRIFPRRFSTYIDWREE